MFKDSAKRKMAILILIAILASVTCVPFARAKEYSTARWESEAGGDVLLSYSGLPPVEAIADYDLHTLRLGVKTWLAGSATAEGWMWTGEGRAEVSDVVIASISWYQKGQLFCYPYPAYAWAYISVMFQAYDVSGSSEILVTEKEVFRVQKDFFSPGSWEDYGTWYLESMEVSLIQGNDYKFVLYVIAQVNCDGIGVCYTDFGGIEMSDRLIEWGYVSVPYMQNLHTLTVDARDQNGDSVPAKIWIDGELVGSPVLRYQVTTGLHEMSIEHVVFIGGGHKYTKCTFQHWNDGVSDNPRIINIEGDMAYTAIYYSEPASHGKL